jgi:hypothetical protein
MFDLCIQQNAVPPYSGPYLRVSPLPSGMVAFTLVDTSIGNRPWHREVPGGDGRSLQIGSWSSCVGSRGQRRLTEASAEQGNHDPLI